MFTEGLPTTSKQTQFISISLSTNIFIYFSMPERLSLLIFFLLFGGGSFHDTCLFFRLSDDILHVLLSTRIFSHISHILILLSAGAYNFSSIPTYLHFESEFSLTLKLTFKQEK